MALYVTTQSQCAALQFDMLKTRIRAVPHPVASFWRSLVPSHLDCAASTSCEWDVPQNGKDRLSDRTECHSQQHSNRLGIAHQR